MVINTKHFVITIIAIFLSLAVGVFIGVIIDSQHLFIEQQKVIVSQIEEEFDGFRKKNYELIEELKGYKKENDRNNEFLDGIYKKLVDENLTEYNIWVINMFADKEYLDLKNILDNIGIKKSTEIEVPKDRETNIEAMRNSFNNCLEMEQSERNEVYQGNREKILSKLVIEGKSLLPFYMKQMNFLEYKGDINSSVDYVIIVDSGFRIKNKHYKSFRKEFISLIKDNGVPVMVIEKSDTELSSVPFYKELDIPTVDNGDTKLGEIAMLMVLKGKEGHFGEKKTAEGLLPEDVFVFE